MAIQFSEIFNNINDGISDIPIFHTILSSIFYTSIVLSIIIIIMLLFICPDDNTPTWIYGKMFVYLFLINSLVFSAHYSIQNAKHKEKNSDIKNNEFITNIGRTGGAYDSIKVVPNFKQNETYETYEDCNETPTENKELTVSDMLDSVEKTL